MTRDELRRLQEQVELRTLTMDEALAAIDELIGDLDMALVMLSASQRTLGDQAAKIRELEPPAPPPEPGG